jgi:N-acetylmuramoyl-L-alanine amidase
MGHYRSNPTIFESAKLQNNVKRLLSIVLTLSILGFSFISAGPRKATYRIKTIVIDAGHGGHDSGCLGSSAKEKHVALAVALKLGKMIEQNYPDVNVIYTRKTDVFIPLHERADIANHAKADLFICIHLNSGGEGAYGPETYVMGLHKTEDNLSVAKRENAAILLEDNYKKQYDGFDPNSPEANIIFSLYQNQFMHQSLEFASNVQEEFEEFAGRNNRGVKQAGFLVLYRTAMPAVLIECGFLTNNLEERYLNSDRGQTTMATSIFRAFKAYKIDNESDSGTKQNPTPVEKEAVKSEPPAKSSNTASENKPAEKTVVIAPKSDTTSTASKPIVKSDTTIAAKTEVKPTPKPEVKPEPKAVIKPEPIQVEKTEPKSEPKVSAPKTETVYTTPAPSSPKPASKHIDEPAIEDTNPVFYAVQIGASTKPETDNSNYLKNKEVKALKCKDGYTRYIIGNFTDFNAARKKLQATKDNLYKDAFLTAFDGENRITIQQAEELLKRK